VICLIINQAFIKWKD